MNNINNKVAYITGGSKGIGLGVAKTLLDAGMRVAISSRTLFFLLVKTAFNQRRKTLRNAVKNLFETNVLADDVFNKRAEQLSVNDFAQLSFKMKLHGTGADNSPRT